MRKVEALDLNINVQIQGRDVLIVVVAVADHETIVWLLGGDARARGSHLGAAGLRGILGGIGGSGINRLGPFVRLAANIMMSFGNRAHSHEGIGNSLAASDSRGCFAGNFALLQLGTAHVLVVKFLVADVDLVDTFGFGECLVGVCLGKRSAPRKSRVEDLVQFLLQFFGFLGVTVRLGKFQVSLDIEAMKNVLLVVEGTLFLQLLVQFVRREAVVDQPIDIGNLSGNLGLGSDLAILDCQGLAVAIVLGL